MVSDSNPSSVLGTQPADKTCTKCGFPKPITDFALRDKTKPNGRRGAYCSECMKPYRRDHYHSNPKPYKDRSKAKKTVDRQWLLQLLSTKSCVDCGETDPVVLDFDHIKGRKIRTISLMLHSNSRGSILKEIQKCVVRCANCHRRKTALERGWYKLGASANGRLADSKSVNGSSSLSAPAK